MARGTPLRNIRVENDLWHIAGRIADVRGETLSDVLRKSLARYVQRHDNLVGVEHDLSAEFCSARTRRGFVQGRTCQACALLASK